jgi:DNA-binding MarR family transcriptional regulator
MSRPPTAEKRALEALDATPGMTTPELGRALGVSRQRAYQIASELVRKSLVTRAGPERAIDRGLDSPTTRYWVLR